MKYKAKRLYEGKVSIRSDRVQKAIDKGEDLIVTYHDQVQVIPWQQLKQPVEVKGSFVSKFDGKSYYLNNYRTHFTKPKVVKEKPQVEGQGELL